MWMLGSAVLRVSPTTTAAGPAPKISVRVRVVASSERETKARRNTKAATPIMIETCTAAGLFIAAVHSMGLVTLTHTPSPMGFLREVLERPANEKPFLLMPVGYPAADAQVPSITRKPLDAITVWR